MQPTHATMQPTHATMQPAATLRHNGDAIIKPYSPVLVLLDGRSYAKGFKGTAIVRARVLTHDSRNGRYVVRLLDRAGDDDGLRLAKRNQIVPAC